LERKAQEQGFFAQSQALQKRSLARASKTDEIYAAGGNMPEVLRRLVESGGDGPQPGGSSSIPIMAETPFG
jgi:hypothetical protein